MNRKTQGPAPHRILLSFHTFGSSFIHMPSLLRRSGFAVDAVFTDLHPLRNLRGISKRFLSQPSEWAATIERLLATGEYCFYQNVDEPGLLALYRHQWTRETARLLPFPPGEAFARTLGSKIDFHKWCLDHSLPVPESHVCETFEEARALARKLPGSWFLKGDAGSGGDTVALSSDIDAGMGAKSGRWLVQRNEGDHISSGVFLVVKGKILAWFGFTKVISLNRGLGPVIHGRVEIPPDTAALCERIAAASGVTGLTGFDFARSPDHGLVIIDSQLGRMVPTQHFCLLYGVDFGAALGRHLRGEDPAPCHPGSGPDFIKFPEVLQLVCQGGLPELLRNLKGKWEMPLAPPGECTVAISNAWRTLVCETRVLLRRERRILCRLRDR